MTSKERVLSALSLKKPDRVPFMEWYIDYEVGQALLKKDSYELPELADFLNLDGVGSYYMPEIYAEFGTSSEGRTFEHGGRLATEKDLDIIQLKSPLGQDSYQDVRRLVDACGENRAVFAGTSIGIDGVLRGMGIENFSYALADNIGLIEKILDIYTEWACEAVIELQKTGVDLIWFADDIGFTTSLMFSPQIFREIFKPRMKKVVDLIKIPTIYHSDGYILPVIEDLIELGFNGVHPMDPCAVSIDKVKAEYGSKICLIGNIDLAYTLVLGSVEEVKNEVRERINTIGFNGGYIVSSANSITYYCKMENVIAMRDAILEYGVL